MLICRPIGPHPVQALLAFVTLDPHPVFLQAAVDLEVGAGGEEADLFSSSVRGIKDLTKGKGQRARTVKEDEGG